MNIEDIIAFCKKFGLIFNSSYIYGGIQGFLDYGPIGCEIKRNIKNVWWEDIVHRKSNILGIDTSIIMNSKVWEASGHIEKFSDLMVDCRESKKRYRADKLFFAKVFSNGSFIKYISILDSENMYKELEKKIEKIQNELNIKLDPVILKPYNYALPEEYDLIPSPTTNNIKTLTKPREFNLMFKTNIGVIESNASSVYLRPETAQGIFVNFKNIINSYRLSLPFGIAQIGKAFRNEITPKNLLFRSREFEQMEIEYFFNIEKNNWKIEYNFWIEESLNWLKSIGLNSSLLSLKQCNKDNLAHYTKDTTDIIFKFPFGNEELAGISYRGSYDLLQHQKFSKKSLEYFDNGKPIIPHVIEPSIGVDRLFLAILCSSYCKEKDRILLKLNHRIAPYKLSILPLVKNKTKITDFSKKIYNILIKKWNILYEDIGSIGKRYRKMDAIGVPLCVTIDFESIEDNKVTIRNRDTMLQKRISIDNLISYISQELSPIN